MSRPLLLIHGYSADGNDFDALCEALVAKGVNAVDVNICNYVSLNNEITIKDIAEGLDRALRMRPELANDEPFDAIVHSTGMLVIRSWLTNYNAAVRSNGRLKRLKHLIGLAPATWGSPQAHKGRTWLGALVKGNKQPGPDFLNAGDQVLDGLELGSKFTWDLAHLDLLGPEPYYGKGPDTPYVCVFIGNTAYQDVAAVANDPGTDGTVRWSGCALDTRKVTIDLTRTPTDESGRPTDRVKISPWAGDRLEIPIIPVEGKNHATLIREPDPDMVGLVVDFLKVGNNDKSFDAWVQKATEFGKKALPKMLLNPGKGSAGLEGAAKAFVEHIFHVAEEQMEGWQQFVVHARDEHGDAVNDFMVEVLVQAEDGSWKAFPEMYTDVHAYKADPSYRCFHVRLPRGICSGKLPMKARINASTGTELMVYQGYGSQDDPKQLKATADPVLVDLGDLGKGNGSLFYPFTTTLVEIVLNRVPFPLDQAGRILQFLPARSKEPAAARGPVLSAV